MRRRLVFANLRVWLYLRRHAVTKSYKNARYAPRCAITNLVLFLGFWPRAKSLGVREVVFRGLRIWLVSIRTSWVVRTVVRWERPDVTVFVFNFT